MNERKTIYLLLCAGCITISFNVAAIAAALPSISTGLGLPSFSVSKIIPFYMIPYGIGALFYAPVTRKFSYRTILVWSSGVYALACLLCASAHSLELLLCGRALMGISAASAIPLGLILIGQLFEKEVRGRLVGFFFSSSFFASIVGIVASGVLNWRWLFYIPALMGLGTTVALVCFRSEIIQQSHGAVVDYVRTLKVPTIRNIFLFIFVLSSLYHGVQQWLGVYFYKIYHMDQMTISFFFMLSALGGAIGQIGGGYLSDKKGRYEACLTGIALLALGTMFLLGTYPLAVLGVVLVFYSVGWTIGHNGLSTVLTDFPDEYRPEIASLNSAVRFVSGGVGFQLAGLFVEKSFGLTFFLIGVLMLGLGLLLPKVVAVKK